MSSDDDTEDSSMRDGKYGRTSKQQDMDSESDPVFLILDYPSRTATLDIPSSMEASPQDGIPDSLFDKQRKIYALHKEDEKGLVASEMKEPGEGEDEQKQSSLVTIFSIWNTMMGTSLLAMPWALQQAGFGFGLFLLFFVALLACYTAYLSLKATENLRVLQGKPSSAFIDISDACQYHFGKAGRLTALVFSVTSLLASTVVYHVLLSNFLYHIGEYIYHSAMQSFPPIPRLPGNITEDLICPRYSAPVPHISDYENDTYHKLWIKDRTVPLWILFILFPLISIKSPTCLSKFSVAGTVAVAYIFILIILKATQWGINMRTPPLIEPVSHYRHYFPALTGTCSLGFYIHNSLQTILRVQRHPENNVRDTVIAFVFVTLTYALLGSIFYIAVPVSKLCIADNFFDNLTHEVPAFIGRVALFLQLALIYPILVYVLRAQLMFAFFENIYPNWYTVFALHLVVIAFGLLFSMLYPSIGTLMRFMGAFCGLFYVFALPTLITLKHEWTQGHQSKCSTDSDEEQSLSASLIPPASNKWRDSTYRQRWYLRFMVYGFIIIFGVLNLIAQFVVFAIE